MPSVLMQKFLACESLGVGHSEGEGRTLRHHPHFTTPTRITVKNASRSVKGIKQTENNCDNLHHFENLNMKCRRINEPYFDLTINNHYDSKTKKSEMKATEETQEQIVKYERNRRIKRKTIKTSEFSHTKTKTTNVENVDGFLNGNKSEELKNIELYDWMKLNDFERKRERRADYDKYQTNNKSEKKFLHHTNRNNEHVSTKLLDSAFYKRNLSREASRDEMRTCSTESTEYESSQDEMKKTYSTESIANDTSSSYEYESYTNCNHVRNTSHSNTSRNFPPISIKKEQWPDIKCKLRILPTKETSCSSSNVVCSKNLESRHYSTSEANWKTTYEKPTATFKIIQKDKGSLREKRDHINESKLTTSNKYSNEKPHSPTVLFRVKSPKNSTSDETSTLSSFSVQSIDRFTTESTTNYFTDYIRKDRSSNYTPPKEKHEYKEDLIEKDFSSEEYKTHSSKEEEIKYQNKPIEISFRIKSYDQESIKSERSTKKFIHKTYSKQSESSCADSNSSAENKDSSRIYNKFINEYEKDSESFSFSDKIDRNPQFKSNKTPEAFRGTSEIIDYRTKPVESHETNTKIYDKKSKSDSYIIKKSSYDSQKSVFNVEERNGQNHSTNTFIEKLKKENKIGNEKSPEKLSSDTKLNLKTEYENKFPSKMTSSAKSCSDFNKKERYQNSLANIMKNNNFYPEDSKFIAINSKHVSEIKSNESFESKEASDATNINKKHSKFDILKEDSVRNDMFRDTLNVIKYNKQKYAPRNVHLKYEKPGEKRKETNDSSTIRKFVDFEELKTENLIFNKYFEANSSQNNSENHPKENRSFGDVSTLSIIHSNTAKPEKRLHNNAYNKKISKLFEVDYPPHSKSSDTKEKAASIQEKDDQISDISNRSKNYEEINNKVNYRKTVLEYLSNDRKNQSLCNNMEWHSINRKEKDKLSSHLDERISTEILTKKTSYIDYEMKRIDKFNDIQRHKLQNESFQKKNDSIKAKNWDGENDLYSHFNSVKMSERTSEENERREEENSEKIDSNDKHFSEIFSHSKASKEIGSEKFYEEVKEKRIRNYPAVNRKILQFDSFDYQDFKRGNKDSETDDRTVKETFTVQVQLSRKGFRIKNWKEEVIIHRMLFTSLSRRRRRISSNDNVKSKNFITEKQFYVGAVDIANTCKVTMLVVPSVEHINN